MQSPSSAKTPPAGSKLWWNLSCHSQVLPHSSITHQHPREACLQLLIHLPQLTSIGLQALFEVRALEEMQLVVPPGTGTLPFHNYLGGGLEKRARQG